MGQWYLGTWVLGSMTHLSRDVGGDDGEQELLLVLLLALELDARRDAVARHLEGLLVRRRGHVLVVVAHQVGAQQQECVGRHLEKNTPLNVLICTPT